MKSPVTIRHAEEGDEKYLTEWLSQGEVLRWFPLANAREIEDAVQIWMSYRKHRSVLTALWNDIPCGSANLYIQPYKKLAHQCLFAILVAESFRGKGVGTILLESLMELAQREFRIELLHLEVYEGNPAIRLYKKLGFEEYGAHAHFIKEEGKYLSKILMQKKLFPIDK